MYKYLMLLVLFCLPVLGRDLSGKWNLMVDTPAGPGTPVLVLKQDGQKLTGTYTGRYGTSQVNGTVKDDDIVFELTMNAEGETVKVVYRGKVENSASMKGEVEFGEFGNGTWKGVKE